LGLRAKSEEKAAFEGKATTEEQKAFQASLASKEEREGAKSLLKSASQTSIEFKAKEAGHEETNLMQVIDTAPGDSSTTANLATGISLTGELRAKAAGDEVSRVDSEIKREGGEDVVVEVEKPVRSEERGEEKRLRVEEAREEGIFTRELPSEEQRQIELKEANLAKCDEKLREFGEEESNSAVAIERKRVAIGSGMAETVLAEGRQPPMAGQLSTLASEEQKTGQEVRLGQSFEGIRTELDLGAKPEEKAELQIKAAGEEQKGFHASFEGREEREGAKSLLKSASQTSIEFKAKEAGHEEVNLLQQFETVPSDSMQMTLLPEGPKLLEQLEAKAASDESAKVETVLLKSADQMNVDLKKPLKSEERVEEKRLKIEDMESESLLIGQGD
jgi:hypothetical protein